VHEGLWCPASSQRRSHWPGRSWKDFSGGGYAFDAGATQCLGKVANGSSVFDYDPDEVTRQKSISSMLGFCEWKNQKINIADTPGYANFTADTQGCMRVLDGAIVLLEVKCWEFVQPSVLRWFRPKAPWLKSSPTPRPFGP